MTSPPRPREPRSEGPLTGPRAARLVGLYAMVAAAAAVVLAPLLALSYFAIPAGAEELDVATVSAWAEPAREAAGGLLTFASADRVYASYTQTFLLLAPALFLCAWVVRSQRPLPLPRAERWGWRLALTGYAMLGLGLVAISIVLIWASSSSSITDLVFLPLIVPGLLLAMIGSTMLGIRFLRSAYRPRLTAWLLALSLPLWIVGSGVLGHNSLGLLPLFCAWAASGWRLRAGLRSQASVTGAPVAEITTPADPVAS